MVGGCGVRGDLPIVRPLDLLQESFLLSPSPPKTARSEVRSLAHEHEMLLGSASPSSAVPVGAGRTGPRVMRLLPCRLRVRTSEEHPPCAAGP